MKKHQISIVVIALMVISIGIFSFSFNNRYLTLSDIEAKPKKEKIEITQFNINYTEFYLAINGTDKITYEIETNIAEPVNVDIDVTNPEIASVTEDGVITGLQKGTTEVTLRALDRKITAIVYVTDLITLKPDEYNYKKPYLKCQQYSKEENDLLDKILASRVSRVGKHTRAGVVEAARFIALEFPYRIAYFSENGRLDNYKVRPYVDGEGRYYHEGLYLDESRYDDLKKTMRGPGTWGCKIYSNPSGHKVTNGFDCSGFITWIVLNGGYDPGDIGAGITSVPDMTDLGKKVKLTEAIKSNTLRAGDLLSGKGSTGGHIALVAGLDEKNYYVAESLWVGTGYFGSVIRTYKREKLTNNFYWQIDMTDYYGEDGKYTEYWK